MRTAILCLSLSGKVALGPFAYARNVVVGVVSAVVALMSVGVSALCWLQQIV